MRPQLAEIEPARRLHSIGVQQRARRRPAHDRGSSLEVVDRADFVVHRHHRDDRHVAIDRGVELIEVSSAVTVDPDDSSVVTLDDVEHAVVLRGGAQRHASVPPHRSGDRRVVALGAPAHEHDLTRQASDDLGDPVPSVVDGPPGLAGEAMGSARVGVAVGEVRQHRVDGDLAHGRRRRMVEVDELLGHAGKATAALVISRWDTRPRPPPGRTPQVVSVRRRGRRGESFGRRCGRGSAPQRRWPLHRGGSRPPGLESDR